MAQTDRGGLGTQRHQLSSISLPGQMEHRLFRVVTRIGAAFVEDQVMFLESEDRGHEEELWGAGGVEPGFRRAQAVHRPRWDSAAAACRVCTKCVTDRYAHGGATGI